MLQQLSNAVVLGSVLTLFAVGLSLAWGSLDVLNMAHGSLFVLGAFAASRIALHWDAPLPVLMVAGMLASGIVAVLIELVAFRRIRSAFTSKRQAELSMLLASVGAATMIDQVVNEPTEGVVFGITGHGAHRYAIGSLNITNYQIMIVVLSVVIAFAMDRWIRQARQGRAIRAIAYDASTAETLGINVNRVAAATMFVSGALAGLAGVLLTLNLSGIDILVGEQYLLIAFAVLIVGGVGSVRGAIIAAYMIAVAQTAVVAYGPGQFQGAVSFVLIFLVLIVRPGGLFARTRAERA